MSSRLEAVVNQVFDRIIPTPNEREKMEEATALIKGRVITEVERGGLKAAVEVGGSFAKDTWLSGEADIDVFILFPTSVSRRMLGEKGLYIAKKAMKGFAWRERFAEHPYLEVNVDGIRVNIVPCYSVDKGKWISAADRSPFHTDYVRKKLSQRDLRDEVRLFKKFTKGIEVYGAEIKVGGFSGYLCELLVLSYSSFIQTLEGISKWRFGQVIDVENHYKGMHNKARRLFNAPLIVIDPIDEDRNVAAAVSKERLGELMAASRLFLEKPETSFFYPTETVPLSPDAMRGNLAKLKFDLILIVFESSKEAPDVLWGQLYKTLRAIKRLLRQRDFRVLTSSAWSNDEGLNALILELETKDLPPSKRHIGPPVDSKEAVDFLKKHLGSENTLTRPWVEGNRWLVGMSRRYVDSASMLREKLKEGGRNIGVASKFVESLKTSKIYVDEDIVDFYSSNRGFARFLTEFLRGKPKWMQLRRQPNH